MTPSPNTQSKLTEIQLKMLEQMLTWQEYCYGYWYFDIYIDGKAVKKEQLKKEMKGLRERGYVKYVRGLINDDGEVCGSGFEINYMKREEIEQLVKSSPTQSKEVEWEKSNHCCKYCEKTTYYQHKNTRELADDVCGSCSKAISSTKQSLQREMADEVCILIDDIESKDHNNTLEEWKQYKHIRNAIRDKYLKEKV